MKTKFKEVQRFTQWWLWLILIGTQPLPIYTIYKQLILKEPFGDNPIPDVILIVFSISIFCLIAMFWFIRLKTEISDKEIRMIFFHLLKSE